MTYRDVVKDIDSGELKTVYLFYGAEMYLKDKIIKMLKQKYLDEAFETLNYSYLDGKSATTDDIVNACETLPFMSDKKIVIVDELPVFKGSTKDTKDSKPQKDDKLSDYIERISETTCLLFILKEDKIDNRKKIVKNIKKVGRVVELEKLKNEELNKWTMEQFKKHKKTINRQELAYFLSSTSYLDKSSEKTLYDLENEIDKLVNYIGDKSEVSKADIEHTKPKSLENDIFKLIDYISQNNTSKAIELFNDMILSGEAVQLILYMVVRQVRLLLVSKLLEEKGYSIKAIGQKINIYHNFIIQKLITQGKSFSEQELTFYLSKCIKVDKDIKTGKIDAKLGVEVLIVEFSQKIHKLK